MDKSVFNLMGMTGVGFWVLVVGIGILTIGTILDAVRYNLHRGAPQMVITRTLSVGLVTGGSGMVILLVDLVTGKFM